MRVESKRSMRWVKAAVAVGVSLLSVPALAQDVGRTSTGQEQQRRGAFLLELTPPALDGSLYGIRAEVSPSRDSRLAFGLLGRAGSWNRSLGAKARFTGVQGGDVKLNFGVGVDGRYTLAFLADGTVRPFLGLAVGMEEFVARATVASPVTKDYTTTAFVEPTLGLMWRPGSGRVGLSARAGPGFTFTDVRELQVGTGNLGLRTVYPTASLGLLVVL
ncbi:hypothetical protein D7V97_33785 [Corallococcus sp. CA053C]|uniref:hypothetical protein n=1 Tax=Corallococcus sp. CA053C TaxID=2316732 RepID=UPI000EA1327C|nr:hypothetical protein [Corallococcus sp. CA053C]RKG97876.1 hypothetical protein D7V97_33785 [Corallococcus sp. CA053C]